MGKRTTAEHLIICIKTHARKFKFTAFVCLQDRLWRKTRSNATGDASDGRCVGVDANRNFPFKWNGACLHSVLFSSSSTQGFSAKSAVVCVSLDCGGNVPASLEKIHLEG